MSLIDWIVLSLSIPGAVASTLDILQTIKKLYGGPQSQDSFRAKIR